MNAGTSNQLGFNPLKRTYPAVRIASGSASGTKTLIATGIAASTAVFDLLFRNLDGSNARNFDIWIGANNTTVENNRCQISVPANSGNNGSIPIASMASLASQLFVNDIAGNRALFLEDTNVSIWVENRANLTADVFVTAILGPFA